MRLVLVKPAPRSQLPRSINRMHSRTLKCTSAQVFSLQHEPSVAASFAPKRNTSSSRNRLTVCMVSHRFGGPIFHHAGVDSGSSELVETHSLRPSPRVHWGKTTTIRQECRIVNFAPLGLHTRGPVDTNKIRRCTHLALTRTGDNGVLSHDASREDVILG